IRGRKGVLGAVTGITLEAIQVSQGWEQTLASMSATVAQFVERSSARDELRRRAMQQTAVADFGRFASGHTLEETLEECVRLVQDTLDIEYVKLLRLLPDERHVRMVAGTGWRPEVLAETEPEDIVDSPAGFTLASRSPVIVADLRSETRFGGGTLLTSHSVRSGMSATIGTFDEPWGVLGAYSARQVDFTEDDLAFLTTMANTLSAAIERARHDAAQRFLLHASDVLASSTDYRDTLRSLAHLVIDEMADWCAVNLFDEDGSAQTLEVAHRDPAKIEALRAMRTQDLEQRRDGRLATRLLAGESVILPYVSEEALRNFTSDEQRVQALAQ